MTHQEFIETAIKHYRQEVLGEPNTSGERLQIYIVWSCKTANNSKCILANNQSNSLCEATLIGSKNLVVYDFYEKFKHEEHAAI